MEHCLNCPRACGVARGAEAPGEGRGRCRMGARAVLARAALHFDEEPCISGSRGSGAVFFSGCPLGCVYCQNAEISGGCRGLPVTSERLRGIFLRLSVDGEAHNLNLVTATHFLQPVLEALEPPPPVPVVWNTSGYETVESLRRLRGKVQIYLPDLKYVDEAGARAYSRAPDYPRVAQRAILEMYGQQGEIELDGEGLARKGVMIRHLILPGRARQSMAALDWIAANLGRNAWVSLMAQYTPCGEAKRRPPLDRRVTRREYERVVEHLFALGLENGYVQELDAAHARYIPAFDCTGLEE